MSVSKAINLYKYLIHKIVIKDSNFFKKYINNFTEMLYQSILKYGVFRQDAFKT